MSDTIENTATVARPEYLPTDLWLYYRKSLAKEDVKGMQHEACPHQGYYKDGNKPVQFYFDTADWALFCVVDNTLVDGFAEYTDVGDGKRAYVGDTPAMRRMVERWTHLCENPVSEEAYKARLKDGYWPGEELNHQLSNMPPAENSYEDILAKLQLAVRTAEGLIKQGGALTKDVADTAQNAVNSLASLAKTADGIRVVEKKPHWDKCLEVDGRWNPLVKQATDVFTRLRKVVLQPWHDAQERARQVAIREAKEAAEKLRREASEREAAARAAEEEAISHGNTAAADFAKKQIEAAEAANSKADQQEAVAQTIEATPTRVGTYGRAGHTRTLKITTITDRQAFRAYAESQAAIRAEYEKLDQKHADAFTRAGITTPGTTVETKKVAA